ncbi:xylan 1,4-beta-xylosidase [Evansella caseinilytica]|uniref:Xylan 1,4-beta-xylosidase n=1 Tax=Evansella caseinilytica TaxID=1503961 RepID=A0A1H3TEL3_9BACI|nr:family 43 glycosylhydrolase [Evansella caseinilytica]SDZ48676.1 xylan 1,4-beta-xylosidase [Evansella caseinilytica]
MVQITSPILAGFHPALAIIMVEKDYSIATSTFAWFTKVLIHHSKDLRNWKFITWLLTKQGKVNFSYK